MLAFVARGAYNRTDHATLAQSAEQTLRKRQVSSSILEGGSFL